MPLRPLRSPLVPTGGGTNPRTVRLVTTTEAPAIAEPDPRDVLLDATALMARYRVSRSTVYGEVVQRPGWPAPVVRGRWRLDHVRAYEDGLVTRSAPTMPVRKRASRASA